MRAFTISKTSLEKAREGTIDPIAYGLISEVLEAAIKDVQIKIAIIPDLHQHLALLMAGTIQRPIALKELIPVLQELINADKLTQVERDFDSQIAQAKATFSGLLALAKERRLQL